MRLLSSEKPSRMKIASLLLLSISVDLLAQGAQCFAPAEYRSADADAEQNFQRGSAYFVQKQYSAAFHYLSVAAQRNHPRAEELMGQMYMFGYGVQQDSKTALRYFNAAAEQGHRGAIMDLGFYYSQVVVDLPAADRYLLAAAQCGSLEAQVELGLNYEFGRGIARNRQQAIHWLLTAAPHWGKAGYIAEWLQDPNTPGFQNIDQLSRYVNYKTGMNIILSTPKPSFPGGINSHGSCGISAVARGNNCYNSTTNERTR